MTIGGFESAWLGDLAVPFILEQNMVKWHFDDTLQKGIYRDDGLTILNRKNKEKRCSNVVGQLPASNKLLRNKYFKNIYSYNMESIQRRQK